MQAQHDVQTKAHRGRAPARPADDESGWKQ